MPSEYWIDTVNELLYFMPPGGDPGAADAFLSLSSYGIAGVGADTLRPGPSMKALDGEGEDGRRRAFAEPVVIPAGSPTLSYVTLEGFSVLYARNTGISIPSAIGVSIVDCDVSNHGHTGVNVFGTNNLVSGVTVTGTGCAATSVGGGDLMTLEAGNNTVQYSTMSQYARIVRTYNPGVCEHRSVFLLCLALERAKT